MNVIYMAYGRHIVVLPIADSQLLICTKYGRRRPGAIMKTATFATSNIEISNRGLQIKEASVQTITNLKSCLAK